MRRLVVAVLGSVLMAGTAMATGFGGSDAPTRIPVPARAFSATVEDRSGTTVEVTKATFDGEVFLFGLLGEGQASVPFERIREVRFEPTEEPGELVAFAVLNEGSPVRLVVEDDTPCYGETSFGLYRIEVKHIRRIVFPVAAAAE
jgi:hypothetical protein